MTPIYQKLAESGAPPSDLSIHPKDFGFAEGFIDELTGVRV
jgi:hypothetical protein